MAASRFVACYSWTVAVASVGDSDCLECLQAKGSDIEACYP